VNVVFFYRTDTGGRAKTSLTSIWKVRTFDCEWFGKNYQIWTIYALAWDSVARFLYESGINMLNFRKQPSIQLIFMRKNSRHCWRPRE